MAAVGFDLTGLSVGLVMPVHRDLPWQVVKSLIETQVLFQCKGIPLRITMQVGSSIIEAARSKSVHEFLQTDANRLFWIDSDIAWEPDDFLRLVVLSTKMDAVCAAYPSKKDPPVFMLGGLDDDGIENEWGCLAIIGAGLGFTVVNRTIIEQLVEKSPRLKFPDVNDPVAHVFRCDTTGNEFRGEDMAFFSDIRELGHKVWMDPTITLSHIGSHAYRASIMDHLRKVGPAI